MSKFKTASPTGTAENPISEELSQKYKKVFSAVFETVSPAVGSCLFVYHFQCVGKYHQCHLFKDAD